jgi:hypothetical protein
LHPKQLAHSLVNRAHSPDQLAYDDMMLTEEGRWAWMHALVTNGVCILKGVPSSLESCQKVAERIAPVSHGYQYGDIFDVTVDAKDTNQAYTTQELNLHMDLPYYESPPGLQVGVGLMGGWVGLMGGWDRWVLRLVGGWVGG